jgi:ApaG protein
MNQKIYLIKVSVETQYLSDQSNPNTDRYVFAYTITLQNQGNIGARLQSRHWKIISEDGHLDEVRGEGVVGEFPHLMPGEQYRYTSGTVFNTTCGTMKGTYQMVADDGVLFDAAIPDFFMTIPRTLH